MLLYSISILYTIPKLSSVSIPNPPAVRRDICLCALFLLCRQMPHSPEEIEPAHPVVPLYRSPFRYESSNPNPLNPFLHSIPGSPGLKPHPLHPFHGIRAQCMKIHSTETNPAAMGGTERNNRLSGKIIAFQKRTDNPGSLPAYLRRCSPCRPESPAASLL